MFGGLSINVDAYFGPLLKAGSTETMAQNHFGQPRFTDRWDTSLWIIEVAKSQNQRAGCPVGSSL